METYSYFADISSWMFITFILGSTLCSMVTSCLEWLNSSKGILSNRIKSLKNKFPGITDSITIQKVRKSLEYKSETESFSDMMTFLGGGLGTMVLIFGLYPFILDAIRTTIPTLGSTMTYIFMALGISMIKTILTAPFSYYYTFVIEDKYKFNKMTKKMFFVDMIKDVIINSIMMSIIITAANYLMDFVTGFDIWSISLISMATITFYFIMESSSMFFMKMFNKFTPLEKINARLLKKVIKLSQKSGLGDNPRVLVMDESSRSTHSNAFVFGLRKNKTIVLFDTLLKGYTEDEILGILAHEFGHSKLHHLAIFRVTTIIQTVVSTSVCLWLAFQPELYKAFGFNWITTENIKEYVLIGYVLAGIPISAIKWILTPLENFLSRKMEYAADSFSSKIMGGTKKSTSTIASALVKLTKENLGDVFPHPLYEKFFYGHPSLENRLKNILGEKVEPKAKHTKETKNGK